MRTYRTLAFGVVALFVPAAATPAWAQPRPWASQFGTPGFDAIYALDGVDGDIYGVGETAGELADQSWAGSCDVVVRAYTGTGEVRWTRQFGSRGCDAGEGIAASADGIYVGGSVELLGPDQTRSGVFDAFVRRYDTDGNEVWTRQFGTGDFVHVAGAAPARHGVYVVGQVCGALPGQAPSGRCDAFVRRYDAEGNELWTRQFGAGIAMANEVDAGPAGVVVVGRVVGALPGQEAVGLRDVLVRMYDAHGNERWTHQFGSAGNDIAWGVDVEGRTVHVAGDTAGALSPDHEYRGGLSDAFVRTYDAGGSELWTRQFGTPGFDRAIRVAADGTQVAVVGRAGGALAPDLSFAGGATDPFIRRYDTGGNETSTIQFGGETEPEAATGVSLDGGDVYVSGGVAGEPFDQPSAGHTDAFVMKLAG